MRNKLVLLLGMTLVLLSFFAFHGGTTGFAVKERVQITSRFIETTPFVVSDTNKVTTLYTDKNFAKRGDEFTLVIDPGVNGVRTRGEIRDGRNQFIQYFYICGLSFTNEKICTSSRNLPLSISRTAYSPTKNPYSFIVYDGTGQKISLSLSVK